MPPRSAPAPQPAAPERRQVRINGAPASVNSLSERLSVLWLTPAMDRLFAGPASDRRRFLDRLVLALEPGHAPHAARYEAAMRARNKLLADLPAPIRNGWPRSSRRWPSMARPSVRRGAHGRGARARHRGVARRAISRAPSSRSDWDAIGRSGRPRLAPPASAMPPPAGRPKARIARISPSLRRPRRMPAAQSSTGEQKALLLGLVLAHAELVAERRGHRRSCCSTKLPRTSIPSAARRCSTASKAAARCG